MGEWKAHVYHVPSDGRPVKLIDGGLFQSDSLGATEGLATLVADNVQNDDKYRDVEHGDMILYTSAYNGTVAGSFLISKREVVVRKL